MKNRKSIPICQMCIFQPVHEMQMRAIKNDSACKIEMNTIKIFEENIKVNYTIAEE